MIRGFYYSNIWYSEDEDTRIMERQKIVAIVPAYNEAPNIGQVLDVLVNTPVINEIVVVDDGSTDNLAQIVSQYPGVTLLVNKLNRGKAYSMERGVSATTAPIIFFCDADLRALTPTIVKSIVDPVRKGSYDMFIGIRNNVMQKTVKLIAINSGERAMTRQFWKQVPNRFKHRYRIEAGLNHVARLKGNKVGWRRFPYYQTLKEKKYGLLKGTVYRWKMNADVGVAYGLSAIENGQQIKEKAKDIKEKLFKRR